MRAYLAIVQRGQPGQAYNVGSGRAHSIGEILEMLLGHTKASIQVREDPARLRPVDVPLLVADTSRLQTDTGWQPAIEIVDALEQTLQYWRKIALHESSTID